MLKENPDLVQQKIISFVNLRKKRIEKGEIASGTLKNYVKVIKFFSDRNNNSSINWKIIYIGLPHLKQHSEDRIPTVEEIKRLIGFEDRRIFNSHDPIGGIFELGGCNFHKFQKKLSCFRSG
jgi:hypothetical protein